MIKLLETLLMYLYIMPARFKELEATFKELKMATENTDSDVDRLDADRVNKDLDNYSFDPISGVADSSANHDPDDNSFGEKAA
jgi:hypothetical protein